MRSVVCVYSNNIKLHHNVEKKVLISLLLNMLLHVLVIYANLILFVLSFKCVFFLP